MNNGRFKDFSRKSEMLSLSPLPSPPDHPCTGMRKEAIPPVALPRHQLRGLTRTRHGSTNALCIWEESY